MKFLIQPIEKYICKLTQHFPKASMKNTDGFKHFLKQITLNNRRVDGTLKLNISRCIATNDIHYNGVIMGAMASQITGVSIVCSSVGSGAEKRKQQSSASLACVRGIHWWPVNSPHTRLVTWKMFPFDDVIMTNVININNQLVGAWNFCPLMIIFVYQFHYLSQRGHRSMWPYGS